MKARDRQQTRWGLLTIIAIWMLIFVPLGALAAPYAAFVVDARSGKVLHSENADTQLHPASLTKMMTLYIAFEAIENGEISLEDNILISAHAASEPPSKLGLKAGQRIKLRYLIRAAAVKSANDAATAIGEAIEGSEAKFARRMNRTAKALGMSRTRFKNAHGLTETGHMSTARDMTAMGRHLFYDYPEYYNLFSRREAYAGVRTVQHTNRRLLNAYKGADGIKTGYTRAAGFNLVASAERGGERIIATVFGGRSTHTRNARVAELLDLGFRKAPTRVALHKPAKPAYMGKAGGGVEGGAGRTVRLASAAAVKKSLRPKTRPVAEVAETPVIVVAKADIEEAIMAAQQAVPVVVATPEIQPAQVAAQTIAQPAAQTITQATTQTTVAREIRVAAASAATIKPLIRPADLTAIQPDPVQEVVTRVSTSGGRNWGVNVGRYPSQYKARKTLLKTALSEIGTLDGSLRKVVKRSNGFDANFMGMSRETADLACRRLQAKQFTCFMIEPG